jgi:ribosomal protein L44E
MPEHYPKNTVSVTVWCKVCRRVTEHRVDGGRRGPCLEHAGKPRKSTRPPAPKSGDLFKEE